MARRSELQFTLETRTSTIRIAEEEIGDCWSFILDVDRVKPVKEMKSLLQTNSNDLSEHLVID